MEPWHLNGQLHTAYAAALAELKPRHTSLPLPQADPVPRANAHVQRPSPEKISKLLHSATSQQAHSGSTRGLPQLTLPAVQDCSEGYIGHVCEHGCKVIGWYPGR